MLLRAALQQRRHDDHRVGDPARSFSVAISALAFGAGGLALAYVGFLSGVLACDESCDGGPWYERADAVEWDVLAAAGILACVCAIASGVLGVLSKRPAGLVFWIVAAVSATLTLGMSFTAYAGDSKPQIVLLAVAWLACGLLPLVWRPRAA